ncbi:MAG: PAS domain S-box protein [Caldilineaceae bacterium]
MEYQSVGREITTQKSLQIEQARQSRAIEEMRQFLQATLDALASSTVVLAPDGAILHVNAAWQRFSLENGGCSPTHYLGENYLTICDAATGVTAMEAPLAAAGIRAVIAGQQTEFNLEYSCQTPALCYWFSMRVTPFAEAPPRRVVVTHVDITARKQAEEAERAQRRLAEALRNSLAALTSSLDVERVMAQILASAATVVPSEAGSIILFEKEGGRVAYTRGFMPDAVTFFADYRFPVGPRRTGGIFVDKQPYFVPDTEVCQEWVPLAANAWIRSSIGTPIEIRGEVIGLLIVDSATPHHFQPQDVKKLQAFAHYAGLALENAYHVSRLEQRVVERTAELQAAKEQVEAILHNSLDGILLIHPDLQIKQTNHAFCALFGCQDAVCYGQSLLDFIHTDDEADLLAGIQTVIHEQRGSHLEVLARRRNGSTFDAELSIGAIKDHGLVCTIHDITERKRTRLALAEERNLLRTVIDAIPDVIYVKDTHHRIILRNTAAFPNFYSAAEQEHMGKTDYSFFPLALAERFHAEEEMILRTGNPLLGSEVQLMGTDGNIVWVSSTKVPLRNLQGEIIGLAGISHDITQRKQDEQQLRLAASLQENVSDAVITADLSFRIRSWNRAAETIYGWRAAEAIGKSCHILETYYASDEERARVRQELLQQGYRYDEVLQQRKDGTALYALRSITLLNDEHRTPYGIVAVIRDITEQKRAAEALREHHDFLQLVIDSLPNVIMVKDRTGRFQLVNECAAQLHGLTPAAMVAKLDIDVNPNQTEVAFFRQKDQETLTHGRPVFIPETTILGRSYQINKIPLKSQAGHEDRLLVVATDITVHKRAEAALQQALQKEKELNELKSRFVSMASHEFRTPLSSILVLTETLQAYRHRLANEQIDQRLGKIQEQVGHLKAIMDDVLQLAQLQAPGRIQPDLLDLDALCQRSWMNFSSNRISPIGSSTIVTVSCHR